MPKGLIFAWFVIFSYLNSNAQDPYVMDSIETAYESAKHDTDKINALFALGEALFVSNPDTAQIITEEVLQLAEKHLPEGPPYDYQKITQLDRKYLSAYAEALNNIGYFHEHVGELSQGLEYYLRGFAIDEALGNEDGMAAGLNNIGGIYQDFGDIDKCLEYLLRGLEVSKRLSNPLGLAHAYNNLGVLYDKQGDVVKGLEYYHKCLKILEETGNMYGVSMTLGNIAGTHLNQGNTKKSLEFLQEGLKVSKDIGDQSGVAKSLNDIGYVYYYHGDPLCTSSKEECQADGVAKGIEYLNKSLKLVTEAGNTQGMASGFSNIGTIYIDQGDLDKGLEFLTKSLTIREEIGDIGGVHVSLTNIARAESALGHVEKAHSYAERSLTIGRKLRSPNKIMYSAIELKGIAIKERNYKLALEMYELSIKMRDSLKNEQTQKATIRQQTKYDFEKEQLIKEQKEKENIRLAAEVTARRNNLQYSIILITIMALFGGILALGFVNVSIRTAEGVIFFSFLILFEFLLVLADPYIERWSGGAPGIKLLFNAGIAALVFPLHSFFESKLKHRIAG